jgi:hypothetical protein
VANGRSIAGSSAAFCGSCAPAPPGATSRNATGPGRPWRRLYRWRREGLWDRLLRHVRTKSDALGEVVWEVNVDSSIARAHQHASGARRRRSRADEKKGSPIRPMKDSDAAGAD